MAILNVVCGIIRQDGKIFIARRKPHLSQGGYWEFPGGKLEPGEDPIAALERELLEELDMTIAHPVYLGEHHHAYDSFSIHLTGYACEFVASTFKMTDHDAWAFVEPVELSAYPIAEADQFFVALLIK